MITYKRFYFDCCQWSIQIKKSSEIELWIEIDWTQLKKRFNAKLKKKITLTGNKEKKFTHNFNQVLTIDLWQKH